MEKMKMHSMNKIDENVKKIAALFPECITEIVNEDGNLEKVVDIDAFRQLFSKTAIEGNQERYQFTWPDKQKAKALVNQEVTSTLRPCREESVNFDTTENLYIEGDNLEVLKLLQETYLGKIKMIYIDPPYNTGKDFVYNDDFKLNLESYKEIDGQFDEYGNQLVLNPESSGKIHTNWLNMIYPRLKLSRDLLSDDGVIFISIDDNEEANLRKVCDEIFNESNFVGNLIIKTSTDNNPRQINTEHEYILCYTRNITSQSSWQAENPKAQLIQAQYEKIKGKVGNIPNLIQEELRGWIKQNSTLLEGVTHYDNVDSRGVFHDGDIANTTFGGYKYEVLHPLTNRPCKIPEKGFRFPEATMMEMIKNDDIMFGKDETTLIKPKKRIEDAKDVLRSVIYEDGRSSTKHFEQLMARDIFQNPKSHTILERLIGFVVSSGDIVLDFFSGSSTTAEAVMNYNAHHNEKIKFIMVQLNENLDSSFEKSDNKGKKTIQNSIKFLDSIGKPHFVTEIGKERIRRAGKQLLDKMNNRNGDLFADDAPALDIGFRDFKLDSSNMNDVYYTPDETDQRMLDGFVSNIKEDRTAEDLLFQVMLDLGVLLSAKIVEEDIGGKKVFNVDNNYLIACFDENVDENVIMEAAKKKPTYFVMRDSSLANDSVSVNFDQIFARYSPDTVRKVL